MDLKSIAYRIFSNRGFFILLLICLYLIVISSLLPYGVVPSLCISLLTPLCVFLIAWPTYSILLPRFTNRPNKKRRHNLYYIIISALLIAIVATILGSVFLPFLYNQFNIQDYTNLSKNSYVILSIVTYLLCHVAYFREKMLGANRREEKLMLEKKNLEIEILKSQINSHFLFNALNNIYSMTYFNVGESSKYVLKLSQMLRYVLDDCNAEKTPLSKEIIYIENYMDFQKARFEKARDIRFDYICDAMTEVFISPMIFQPLIENCFKHSSLDLDDNSYVHIKFIVNDNRIVFFSKNSQASIKQSVSKEHHGIGIKNLIERLTLIYQDRFCLTIRDEKEFYQTELIINI